MVTTFSSLCGCFWCGMGVTWMDYTMPGLSPHFHFEPWNLDGRPPSTEERRGWRASQSNVMPEADGLSLGDGLDARENPPLA